MSSGPEINTFITDNRHLIKKTLSLSVCTNMVSKKLGQSEVCAAPFTVSQGFSKNLTSRYKQLTFTVKTSSYLAYTSVNVTEKNTFTRFKKRQHQRLDTSTWFNPTTQQQWVNSQAHWGKHGAHNAFWLIHQGHSAHPHHYIPSQDRPEGKGTGTWGHPTASWHWTTPPPSQWICRSLAHVWSVAF